MDRGQGARAGEEAEENVEEENVEEEDVEEEDVEGENVEEEDVEEENVEEENVEEEDVEEARAAEHRAGQSHLISHTQVPKSHLKHYHFPILQRPRQSGRSLPLHDAARGPKQLGLW